MATLHEPVRFVIGLDPKTKKNSMQPRLGKGGVFRGMMQSEIYQQYERDCLCVIPQAVRLGISEPVNIRAIYYRKTRHRVDKTNLESALLDVLVKAGVLVDDNCTIVVGTDGSRVRYDKHNPRTEVEITEATDEPYQVGMDLSEEDDW